MTGNPSPSYNDGYTIAATCLVEQSHRVVVNERGEHHPVADAELVGRGPKRGELRRARLGAGEHELMAIAKMRRQARIRLYQRA